MATIKVSEEAEMMLSRLAAKSTETCRKALFEGAKVMADGMKSQIESLPTDDRTIRVDKDDPAKTGLLNGPKTAQKQGLLDSFGIAKFREEGTAITTSLGFDGYNSIVTKRWPKGQPNSMVARSVNAGTYFIKATPFIDRAKRQYRKAAEARMEEVIKEEVEKEN